MRLLWLPEVLRAAGLTVHEVSGWQTRTARDDNNNPLPFGPILGVTCHATAGSQTSTTAGEIGVLIKGSPTAPPPIAQCYLARNGDWHVVAAGYCYHNLIGWGGPNKGLGNKNLIGVEAGNNNRGEPWPAVQLDSYRRGVAAICRHLAIPAARVAGHYEHQPGDKSDPLGINMDTFRAAVARLIEEDDVTAEQNWEYPILNPVTGNKASAEWRLLDTERNTSTILKEIAEIQAALQVIAGRDPVLAVREEMAKLAPVLAAVVRDEIPDANEDALVAAFRRLFGSVDETPTG